MESTKYYRLDQLPEPDYFELELEKIHYPPPSRLDRARQWARRYIVIVGLVALFLFAAALYAGLQLKSRPTLVGILHPESSTSLKALAEVSTGDQVPVPVEVNAEKNTTLSQTGNTVTVDVAGVDVNTGTNETAADADDAGSRVVLDLSDTDASSSDSDNIMAEGGAPKNGTDKPVVEQDNGQVSIHDAPPENKEPLLPIKATFYSGVEGPKACRGHVIAVIDMPKAPAGQTPAPTAAQCYNFPGMQTSGCANFVANKVDGCVAQVFAETNCRTYMNTAAFMAENRPVGGNWKSVRVQCGLPEPDPATLGKPPMVDSISSLKDNDKAKAGA